MINGALANLLTAHIQESSVDPVGNNMEYGDSIVDISNVGVESGPYGEFAPLTPGGLVRA